MNATPPVLLTVWRRPEPTRRVLAAIRAAQPARLFVASDGPRDGGADRSSVLTTRRIIEEGVDWKCSVETLYREDNLGCRRAMAGALDWFFDRVPEGIILEDDCIPDPDFFPYCAELLNRYRSDDRVMHISGDNSTGLQWDGPESYRFVRWPQVWGWASWRRAWRHYDRDLTAWMEATRDRGSRQLMPDPIERAVWLPIFTRLRDTGVPDSWAYPWVATTLRLGGLSVVPRTNLISNTGFGSDATHTRDAEHPRADRPTSAIRPLHHPPVVEVDPSVDLALLVNSTMGQNFAAYPRALRGPASRAYVFARRLLARLGAKRLKS